VFSICLKNRLFFATYKPEKEKYVILPKTIQVQFSDRYLDEPPPFSVYTTFKEKYTICVKSVIFNKLQHTFKSFGKELSMM
jgi:hypothetical protein